MSAAERDQVMQGVKNSACFEQSKKAILQVKGIIGLTRLAFFFVPLAFTTSFFGMKFANPCQVCFAAYIAVFAVAVAI